MGEKFPKVIWSWISEHWGLKLVSLFLAIGFWFYAGGKESVEVVRNIPIQIETEGEHFSIAKRSVGSINVRLQATRGLLSVLSSGEMSAFHRVSGISQVGDYSFRLTPADIKVPSDEIRVVSIFPETITVTIDETITKKLPVQPNFVGDPAFGYKVLNDKIETDPDAIMVEGPKAKLGEVNFVKTEPIELVGRSHSFRKLVRIVLEPHLRATSDTIIDVFVPIREEYSERKYENIVVKPLGLPGDGSYIDLKTKSVTFDLKGPKDELERIATKGIFAYVDVTDLAAGAHELPAKMILPETVSLKNDTPPLVKLSIEKVK